MKIIIKCIGNIINHDWEAPKYMLDFLKSIDIFTNIKPRNKGHMEFLHKGPLDTPVDFFKQTKVCILTQKKTNTFGNKVIFVSFSELSKLLFKINTNLNFLDI